MSEESPDWVYASVDEVYASGYGGANGVATLHLVVNPPSPPLTRKKTFLETLSSFSDQSLWRDLQVDGNGEWIHTSL